MEEPKKTEKEERLEKIMCSTLPPMPEKRRIRVKQYLEKEQSILPMVISVDGKLSDEILEVIVCSAISGKANYKNDMPESLTLVRKTKDGKEYSCRYTQEKGK